MIGLLDLIDKLELDQKTINDFKRENIFYIYELLEINPNSIIGKKRPITLTKKQKNDIKRGLEANNLKYVFEMDETEKSNYYELLKGKIKEKKGQEIESLDIDFFKLSARIRNGLIRSGIDSLFKLSRMNIRELHEIRNLGESSVPIILEIIHNLGIYLHGEDISKIDKINTVKDTYETVKEKNLFLIDEAKEIIDRKSNKLELLDMMKNLNRIIEQENAAEHEVNNELVSYMFMILEILKNDGNNAKIDEIERLLKELYFFDTDDVKKIIRNSN